MENRNCLDNKSKINHSPLSLASNLGVKHSVTTTLITHKQGCPLTLSVIKGIFISLPDISPTCTHTHTQTHTSHFISPIFFLLLLLLLSLSPPFIKTPGTSSYAYILSPTCNTMRMTSTGLILYVGYNITCRITIITQFNFNTY